MDETCVGCETLSEYFEHEKKRSDDIQEYFLDFLGQGCLDHIDENGTSFYDSMCISTYECGLQFAIDNDWIDEKQRLR